MHLIDKDNQSSPSAFIPFCDFGGNMSAMGVKIDEFDVPVCNSFKAKVLNNQLCYEVDLNNFTNKNNIDKELTLGFNLIMDYNEDRQVTFDRNISTATNKNMAVKVVKSDEDDHASIYLDTIGNKNMCVISIY